MNMRVSESNSDGFRSRGVGRMRRFLGWLWLGFVCWAIGVPGTFAAIVLRDTGYHVYPGDDIQDALEQAAGNSTNKTVIVHSGEYCPIRKRQAMVWFNKKHEGVRLMAEGTVTLTAANPALTTPQSPGFPAVVNHVVYFGDGISSNTLLQGFRITGANHYVTDKLTTLMEPDTTVPKNSFFLTDGGAIKIFGRSYPTIRSVTVVDNYASPCGAGISVQHQGNNQQEVIIENCVFLRNRAQVTGSAVDLLEGSAARLINCLLVSNVSNTGKDIVALRAGEPPFTNSGVMTIFQNSTALVERCTFAGNRNAVDDLGGASTYRDCIFADNSLAAGWPGTERYEIDLQTGGRVSGCLFRGIIRDPSHSVSAQQNQLNAPPPQFDQYYVPMAPEYKGAGYRPATQKDEP